MAVTSPPVESSSGEEICGLSRGCSALLQACSVGAPFACSVGVKRKRAEGRKKNPQRVGRQGFNAQCCT